MASDVRYSTAAHNGFLDTLNTRLGSGAKLRFYSGTKPATAEDALSGNTLLAELALSASPFGSAASRVLTAASITTDPTADATGTVAWASFVTSGGTRVIDVTAGEAADSADITLNTKSVVAGVQFAITGFSLTHNL